MKQMISTQSRIRKMVTLALFLSITLVIGIVERSIPFDMAVPGVKLGLANVVILSMLYFFKSSEVLVVVILKCVLISIFAGSPTSLIYSMAGSLLSFTVMALLVKRGSTAVSPVGISVVGAICHNIGQIVAASFVLGTNKIVLYLPLLLFAGIITGILVGLTAKELVKKLNALTI